MNSLKYWMHTQRGECLFEGTHSARLCIAAVDTDSHSCPRVALKISLTHGMDQQAWGGERA